MENASAEPVAGPSYSPPQRTPPLPLSKRISSRNALRDTFQDAPTGSPPSTPPNNRRRSSRTKGKGKQPLRAYASAEDGINHRHSHGLSWGSTTRDSVVDNLLFSLDNLSRPDGVEEVEDGIVDTEFDRAKYMFPHGPPLPTNRTARRARGHTHSSSLSTDYGRQSAMPSSPSTPPAKGRRSVSGSNFSIQNGVNGRVRASSKLSEATTSSAETPKPTTNNVITNGTHTRKESDDVGSLDNVHAPVADRKWKRRSLSMDQIYALPVIPSSSVLDRGRPVPSVYSKYESSWDVAPEPMIPAGPRKQQNPTATGPVFINAPPPRASLRKITTQTDLRGSSSNQSPLSPTIPPEVRNQASEFVRNSSMHVTPLGLQDSSKPLPSPSLRPPSAKNAQLNQKERPGFFKRVFGGGSYRSTTGFPERTDSIQSKEASNVPVRTSSSNGSQPPRTATRQSSKEHPAGVSHPPVSLNKKPSSFFRRRKKSVSENPPPLPLPLGADSTKTKAPELSPSVSSLRQVMDPFLSAQGKPVNGAPREKEEDSSRPGTRESMTEDSEDPDIFHSGYTPPASLKPKYSVEQEDSSKAKLKVKKRKPEMLTTRLDTSHIAALSTPTGESMRVSPLTDVPPDSKENDRPPSRASTGDRIIASGRTISPAEPKQDSRKPSVVSTNSSIKPEESWIRKASQERPDSNASGNRLYLQPSASEEKIHSAREDLATVPELHSRNTSQVNESLTSPAFHTATSATFGSAVHSPTSPSSQYHSATSLPLPAVQVDGVEPKRSVEIDGARNLPSDIVGEGAEYRERARKIFEGDQEDVTKTEAASWLGEQNLLSKRTLDAYMQLFDFTGFNILVALRLLCGKLVLKGETQQFDRIITALSARWCECNANHGFKAQDVVHTICYSLILLNTDLHMADIGEKMSRSAYVKNTLPTIRRVVIDAEPNAFDETIKPLQHPSRPILPWSDSNNSVQSTAYPKSPNERTSFDQDRPAASKRMSMRPPLDRRESDGPDGVGGVSSNALVDKPWTSSMRGWEVELEAILKTFFVSIKSDPLPLLGAPPIAEAYPSERNLSVAPQLNRTGSVISKTPSEAASYRSKPGFRTMGFQGGKYARTRPKVYPASTLNSSMTSFDEGNSLWSPAQSTTWSKYSFSKTLTSASMQSLGQSVNDFKHSIGFANALSEAIIREENAAGTDNESVSITVPVGLLEDETLALEGAPWAKEGLVKHKHHLETPGKKAKERSWTDCFAVISKGKLTLFAFNTSAKSMSMGRKTLSKQQSGARSASVTAPRVGGGDWMENAEQLDVFILRQTIASTLPPPGYSKTRPHVWALSLPSGAVHLFQVGTPEIAREFMSTANYWSARLSKEPLAGGVSNIEYGWGEQVINTALVGGGERPGSPPVSSPPTSIQNRQYSHAYSNSGSGISRPSVTSSLRTSMDTGFGGKPKLPGDKVQIHDWTPPVQSMMASQLMEVDQLKGLTAYVTNVEAELAKHNELKHAIELAYSPRHANYQRAMANWQRKSDHLLRENVKFQTYVDSLSGAQRAREEVYSKRTADESVKADANSEEAAVDTN